MNQNFKLVVVALACLISQVGYAQIMRDTSGAMDMVTLVNPGGTYFSVPTTLDPSAIGCSSNKLQAWFEDVDDGSGNGVQVRTNQGFDDPTFGSQARSCVCSVLSYLESLLNINSQVSSSNPIIIKFSKFSTTPFLMPFLEAEVRPNYPFGIAGYSHSYMGNAIINGGNNLSLYHAGTIRVNFAHSYSYCQQPSGCEEDFYSAILHVVTHILGFTSGLEKSTYPSPTLNTPLGPGAFTKFDEFYLYYKNSPSSLSKIVSGTPPAITVSTSTLISSADQVWVNGDLLSNSRTNQPIADEPNYPLTTLNQSYSHLHEDFLFRSYESPGFEPAYVMDHHIKPGFTRRTYSLQELRILAGIGFSFISNFPLSNKPPYTLGNVITPPGIINQLYTTPPAGNSALYTTTTTCKPITIDLNASGGGTIQKWDQTISAYTTHSLGVYDPNPNTTISVYDDNVHDPFFRITGCTNNQGISLSAPILQLNSTKTQIIFTPRPNFIGRARFGFHLYDGTERGSFVVINIDVSEDRTCLVPLNCNLVMNGEFEEGSEYNQYNSATGTYNMKCLADNTNMMDNYVPSGVNNAQVMTDGLEPFPSSVPQITVVDGYTPTYCWGPCYSYYTGSALSFPFITYMSPPFVVGTAKMPLPHTTPTINKRYMENGWDNNLTLYDAPLPNAIYQIDFDYLSASALAGGRFDLYFNNTQFAGSVSYPPCGGNYVCGGSTITVTSANTNNWLHYSDIFTYNGSSGNNYMRLVLNALLNYDNVVLSRILCPTITASGTLLPITLTATVPGGNVSYQWKDALGNNIPGATGQTYIATSYGTYSVEVSDINGCTSAGSSCSTKVIVLREPCPQFFASVINAGYVTNSSTLPVLKNASINSTTLSSSGNVFIVDGTLTVYDPSAPVQFNNYMMLMMPGSSIQVYKATHLDIEGSHLGTCPDSTHTWKGIELNPEAASIKISQASLIEDAENAVYVSNPFVVPVKYKIIETDNAIFNRNRVGINIDQHKIRMNGAYRFVNTVFTSRDLDVKSDFTFWDVPAVLKGYKTPTPPYLLDDTRAYSLKDFKAGGMCYAGIYLTNDGVSTNVSSGVYSYTDIPVGETGSQDDRNLFDYLRCGIESHNSNLNVNQSTFMNMRYYGPAFIPNTRSNGGDGIYADDSKTGLPVELHADGVSSYTDPMRNEFYEGQRGVEGVGLFDVLVAHGFFASANATLSKTGPTNTMWNGVVLTTGPLYHTMAAVGNNMTNIIYPISIENNKNLAGSTPTEIVANENIIDEATAPAGAANANYNLGILVNNKNSITTQLSFSYPPPVDASYNVMHGVYNGIVVSNFRNQWSRTKSNYVAMQEASGQLKQIGILTENNYDNRVTENQDVLSTGITNDNARGIACSGDVKPTVNCNHVLDVGRGFEFYNLYTTGNWLNNEMTNHNEGLVLSWAVIGPQPGGTTQGSNNLWLGTSWPSSQQPPSVGPWHTLVTNVSSTASPLNILNLTAGSNTVPWNNVGIPAINSYDPLALRGIVQVYGSAYTGCGPFWQPNYRRTSGGSVSNPKQPLDILEAIAQDSLLGNTNTARATWIAQMQLYTALLADTTLKDSSAILNAFYSIGNSSRFDQLAAIEDSLATGNDVAAATLISALPITGHCIHGSLATVIKDGPAGDSIVANYLAYYNLYLRWHNGTFSSTDSNSLAALALLCPHLDGNVVYQARALLRDVSKQYVVYYDNCSAGGQGGNSERKASSETVQQQYSLYPNPNDGNMQLWQLITDESPVEVKVYNTVGALIYKSTRTFMGNSSNLSVQKFAPGMYYVTLQDGKGETYTLRFVKQQ